MEDQNQGAGKPEPDNKEDTIAKLTEQIENLNKGIATYRDEAKSAKDTAAKADQAATQAQSQLEELKKLGEKKDDGVKLTPAEEEKLAMFAKQQGLVSKADLD